MFACQAAGDCSCWAVSLCGWEPFLRPGLTVAKRRAQGRSRLALRPPRHAARNAALTGPSTAPGLCWPGRSCAPRLRQEVRRRGRLIGRALGHHRPCDPGQLIGKRRIIPAKRSARWDRKKDRRFDLLRSRIRLRLSGMTSCEASSARVARWPDRQAP